VQAIAPDAVISMQELGRAMIRAARQRAPKRVLENRDRRKLGAPSIGHGSRWLERSAALSM
jgi:hypothetical protein